MPSNQQGFVGLLIVVAVAVAGAVGGTAYVEKKAKDNASLKTEINDVRESLQISKTESTEKLPAINADTLASLNNDSRYSTFVSLIKSAGVSDQFTQNDITVFVPSNEAFNKLPPGKLDDISKDPAKLKAMLTYHIVKGKYDSRQLANQASLPTAQGSAIGVSMVDGQPRINGISISKTDIKTGSGIMHVIDDVLLPSM